MGIVVIACFKPREGKRDMLLEVVRGHQAILRKEGLISSRDGYVMKTKEGDIIEVFEWKSEKAIEEAHKNIDVLKLWEKFEEACEYIPLTNIDESKTLFPGFEPLNY